MMQTEQELKAVQSVKDFIYTTDDLLKEHKNNLIDIYKEYSTFKADKRFDWSNTFKVNKAKEVVEKILPRLIGRNPKWIVSGKNIESDAKHIEMIQDYLTYNFDENALMDRVKLWAKTGVVFGYGFSKVKYKSETAMIVKEGEDGEYTEQEVVGEYPTIDAVSFTDIYFDPRYIHSSDMPAIAEKIYQVRLSDLYANPKYKNVEMLEQLCDASMEDDADTFRRQAFDIAGIHVSGAETFDKNEVTITKYYGYFNPSENDDPKKEKVYEIQVANDAVVIYMEEILEHPYVDFKCFEDPSNFFATGFVEPILEIQKEYNFKKQSAAEYINGALNRSWLWSPTSGINPASLVNRPNNIIATSTTVQQAQANLQELPHRSIDPAYFQEQNDFERQIQSQTFTIDTSNSRGQQALTDTATGARIKFFENNAVIDEVRKNLERSLEKLAYKLLQATFENVKDNLIFKKQGSEEYWEVNKEALKNAIQKYNIKIETNSSSFDYMEDRRSDAIAFANVLRQGLESGAVDEKGMRNAMVDIIGTFEKKNPEKYLKSVTIDEFLPQQPQQPGMEGMPQGQPQPGGSMGKLPMPEQEPKGAELVQQVAQGKLLK